VRDSVPVGSVIGFGATRVLATGAGTVSMLCDLFVDPGAHGSGCGRAMLAELWSAPESRMTFSSLHSNALPLYAGPMIIAHGRGDRAEQACWPCADPR